MPRNVRWALAALAIVVGAACNRPNLESSGGGYAAADSTGAETPSTPGGPATPAGSAASDTAPGS